MIDTQSVIQAIENFNQDWIEKYGTDERDCCGSAVVLIKTGRKIKIKRELEREGHLFQYWDSRKAWQYDMPKVESPIGYGDWSYREARARAVQKELERQFQSLGVVGLELKVHSWCD